MSKDKHKENIVYALSDYKQLVLAYKTKYAELVKRHAFWRISAFWLFVLVACLFFLFIFEKSEKNRILDADHTEIKILGKKLEMVSAQLYRAQQELDASKGEMSKKDNRIRQLEENVSNASKQLIENMLKESN